MLMHKIIKITFILLFSQSFRPSLAQNSTEIQSYFGFHQVDLKWSIAGDINGENPNVLSELMWENLSGPMTGFRLNHQLTKSLSATLDFNFAAITKGFVTDADFAADDRKQNFYNQLFKSDKGADVSLKATLAYKLLTTKNVIVSPFLGFELRKQQVFLFDIVPLAERYLNSSYKNIWQGGIFGINTYLSAKTFSINLSLAGSYLSYNAKAKWNLIPQFAQPISFKHKTKALSLHGNVDAKYALNKNFSATINMGYLYAKGLKGTDEAYYVLNSSIKTQLNEVKSSNYEIGAGFNYQF